MNYIIIGSGRDPFAEAVRLTHAAGLLWSSCIDKAGDWCICMDDDAPRDVVETIASATMADIFEGSEAVMTCDAFLRAPDWEALRQCGSVIKDSSVGWSSRR